MAAGKLSLIDINNFKASFIPTAGAADRIITIPDTFDYLPLAGGTLTGDLNVNAMLYVDGDSTTHETVVTGGDAWGTVYMKEKTSSAKTYIASDFSSYGNTSPVVQIGSIGNTGTDLGYTEFKDGGVNSWQYNSPNGVATSLTEGAAVFTGTSGAIIMDNSGQKRIYWNDGGGNFGIRTGNYFNSSEKYVVTGDGATEIEMASDAAEGKITLRTAPTGTAGNTVSWAHSLELSASGGLKYDGNDISGIGVGQSWATYGTSLRNVNITYTNTTGKPIKVRIVLALTAAAHNYIWVNGVVADRNYCNPTYQIYMQLEAIVPNGHTYKVSNNSVNSIIPLWAELR